VNSRILGVRDTQPVDVRSSRGDSLANVVSESDIHPDAQIAVADLAHTDGDHVTACVQQVLHRRKSFQ
jgi:hypothetical protein